MLRQPRRAEASRPSTAVRTSSTACWTAGAGDRYPASAHDRILGGRAQEAVFVRREGRAAKPGLRTALQFRRKRPCGAGCVGRRQTRADSPGRGKSHSAAAGAGAGILASVTREGHKPAAR